MLQSGAADITFAQDGGDRATGRTPQEEGQRDAGDDRQPAWQCVGLQGGQAEQDQPIVATVDQCRTCAHRDPSHAVAQYPRKADTAQSE